MRPTFRIAFTGALAIVLLGMVSVSTATAQCALFGWHKTGAMQLQGWQGTSRLTPASLSLAAGQTAADDRIVGFWKVKFVSEGTPGIPDGTVIDNAFVQWHGDGTEIMNSSRPPATGNFCLGVWRKSGPSSYDLNHFGLSSDPGGTLIGPAQIREQVTLDRSGDRYEGTFTIDQYDLSGNPGPHLAGRITATRITVETSVADVL
ncbi:MAG TPA: hypothetical protein VGA31_10255 [Thermoanaerobaculia bacterium]